MGKKQVQVFQQRNKVSKEFQQFAKRQFFQNSGLNILLKRILSSIQIQAGNFHLCHCHLPGGKHYSKELRYCKHLWNSQRCQYQRSVLEKTLSSEEKFQSLISQNIKHTNRQSEVLNYKQQRQIKGYLRQKLQITQKFIKTLKNIQKRQQYSTYQQSKISESKIKLC